MMDLRERRANRNKIKDKDRSIRDITVHSAVCQRVCDVYLKNNSLNITEERAEE